MLKTFLHLYFHSLDISSKAIFIHWVFLPDYVLVDWAHGVRMECRRGYGSGT